MSCNNPNSPLNKLFSDKRRDPIRVLQEARPAIGELERISLTRSASDQRYTKSTVFTSSVNGLQTQIGTNIGNIATNTSSIGTNTGNIATNTTSIGNNSSGISTNTSNIATNTSDIGTNTTNITNVIDNVNDLSNEPFITSASSGDLANERVFSDGSNTEVDIDTSGQIKVNLSGLTTKGDIFARTGSTITRLSIGNNGQVLTADSGESTGLAWVTPAAGHDAVTLSTDLNNNLLGLSNQELRLDDQSANRVFAGPESGGADPPDFRFLVADDIPDLSGSYPPTSRTVSAGSGLTGGGSLSSNITLNVGEGDGITVDNDEVALTTPGTLTGTSSNSASGNHTHEIAAYDDPGTSSNRLLKTGSGGLLKLETLIVTGNMFVGDDITPGADLEINDTVLVGADVRAAEGMRIGSTSGDAGQSTLVMMERSTWPVSHTNAVVLAWNGTDLRLVKDNGDRFTIDMTAA